MDLDLTDREITVVLGPSGCGKTTFLRILAGLTEPDAGEVTLDGEVLNDPRSRVPPEARGVGMVFQDPLLWPHKRVRSNIGFPLGPGRNNDPRVAKAAEAAEIAGFLERFPAELSGGERQRAAIARAIVGEPRLLLLDEPLSSLDANLRVRLLGTIREIQRSLGVTTCYVTHDQVEALSLADRVVVMRGGRVLQVGTPEEVYARPRTRFVAGFVGLSSLFEGTAAEGRAETPLGSFPVDEATVGPVLLAARPETVRLDGPAGVPGRVVRSVFRGDRWLVTVRVGELTVLAACAGPREAGEEVTVSLDPAPVPVIDDEEAA
ncbi:MAG: ABC transporter ATP-binding protein [Planctomycetota bacterium]